MTLAAGTMLSSLVKLPDDLPLVGIALFAAIVNGAIGYGFSTMVVPIALLFFPTRVLNPGIVLAEIVLNLLSLVLNRRAIARVWLRVLPMMLASLPGILIGAAILKSVSSNMLRFGTYVVLLPLVLLQTAGVRRPIPQGSRADLPLGLGIGFLYSCTTISGPPLGLLFNNQGLAQDEFRAALSLFRVTESVATTLLYASFSMFTPESLGLSALILPCILIGIPIGRRVISSLEPEIFRRICMAADAWLISFGLSRLLAASGAISASFAYAPMIIVVLLDGILLHRYFQARRTERA